jgi:hypothetical protein
MTSDSRTIYCTDPTCATALRSARATAHLGQMLVLAALAGLWGGPAHAQSRPDVSTAEKAAQYWMSRCENWRVSDGAGYKAAKVLGRPTASLCREIADKWSEPVAKAYRPWSSRHPSDAVSLTARLEACRDAAEKLTGRPVANPRCSTWYRVRGEETIAGAHPPDDIWDAVGASTFRGIEDRLREALERRLGKDWDATRLQTELELLAFACQEVNEANSTLRLTCAAATSEVFGPLPSPSASFLRIWVEVRFPEGEGPRSRQIEVKVRGATIF